MQITEEQAAAIASRGKTIVSASAGSGKTFVMIRKLVEAIADGADLDNVLAVTFTKKAAAQMKEKLRSAIIKRMENADDELRARLKFQLSKIPSANISTIHSFCAGLLRTYFYAVGIDGTFDIVSADDAQAKEYKKRALDNLFERYYAEDNASFKTLLQCYRKKRSDGFLRGLLLESYEKLRMTARYADLLDAMKDLYTEEGFRRVCEGLENYANEQYAALQREVENFAAGFVNANAEAYEKLFGEMLHALDCAVRGGIFAPKPPLTVTRKPADKKQDKESGEQFKAFKEELTKRYKAAAGDLEDEAAERRYFFRSGETALAFAEVLKDFDAEYTAIKRDENKLDYNDLEHLTLALLDVESVRREIVARYSYVFVDEYQDVNPVQEEILTLVGGENVFLVGDVKQAIYGFRGSKSLFFAEKYHRFEDGGGTALRLSSNFRSSDGVVDFVNRAFSQIMTEESCGIDYANESKMQFGGKYPAGFGGAQIHVFGKDEQENSEAQVYSVRAGATAVRHTRGGRAVLDVVERELKSRHYDADRGEYVDTQPGDICILARKKGSASVLGVIRALTDAGYSVAGAKEENICNRPEVRQMLDILSYIDNSAQDIPLVTALLSPLGGLSCDDLAAVRVAAKRERGKSFRECCEKYLELRNPIARKMEKFYEKTKALRRLSEIFTAAELIDKILEDTGLEAVYSSGGGEKLRNLRRLAREGEGLSVSAFLAKLKEGGYAVSAPASASSDSIKVMTMHASKGLEFPVVILADICASFKGKDKNDMPFDDVFGFAPKSFDAERMRTNNTVLRRLTLARAAREELKNELNLFYVACTRAKCRLHIMAEEAKPFRPLAAGKAGCYADLFDLAQFMPEELPPCRDFTGREQFRPLISTPDAELKSRIEERFMRAYPHAESVNLPVKSSASAILRLSAEDTCYTPHELFGGEGETSTERGTAYHRFLELCDFSRRSPSEIALQLERFVSERRMTEEQRALLDVGELAEILSMPVFSQLGDATLFREQEFLCRLPACSVLEDTTAEDGVLLQGAIDLLAVTDGGVRIIDYKYSHKDDEALIRDYSRQLALYRKAAALIMRVDENTIGTVIVNIFRRRQINLN